MGKKYTFNKMGLEENHRLQIRKGLLCSMEALDFLLNATFEPFKQVSNKPHVKRMIRHHIDKGKAGINCSFKCSGNAKTSEILEEGKAFLENLNFKKGLEVD